MDDTGPAFAYSSPVVENVHQRQRNMRCAVLGGTRELKRLLLDVERIKQGGTALVQEHGEDRLLSALDRCEEREEAAEIFCSTAHRAKGREWNDVRLDPDFESGFVRAARTHGKQEQTKSSFEAEARLLYVALTRARLAVHLPFGIQKRFGLRNTTGDILGASKAERAHVLPADKENTPSHASQVISPYHSPSATDSTEMAALKRIFRSRNSVWEERERCCREGPLPNSAI